MSAKIQLWNLTSKFQINFEFLFSYSTLKLYVEHWIFEIDIEVNKTNVPWEPKMLIGSLCHVSIHWVFSMSIKRGMEVSFSMACTRGQDSFYSNIKKRTDMLWDTF